uniref:Short neuropeptide F n=1 Tax=Steinernema glaseri TaxID=37863 RepID=A0A1I7Z337_9BILA
MSNRCIPVFLVLTFTLTSTLGSLDVMLDKSSRDLSPDETAMLLRMLAGAQDAPGPSRNRFQSLPDTVYLNLAPEEATENVRKRSFRFVGSRGKKSSPFMKRFSYLPARGRRSSFT